MKLILASSSKYRAQLLKNEGLNPHILKPQVNEDEIKQKYQQKEPTYIAKKLAELKAKQVLKDNLIEPAFVIIGSDQICVFNNEILNKPGNLQKNIEHLKKLSGQYHQLITSVCLLYQREPNLPVHTIEFTDITEFKMKTLSEGEIISYVEKDKPYDCAGGYKYELNGSALMSEVLTKDETAIQGLPMKKTLSHLKEIGLI